MRAPKNLKRILAIANLPLQLALAQIPMATALAQEISTDLASVTPATVKKPSLSRSEFFYQPGESTWYFEFAPSFQKTVEANSFVQDESRTGLAVGYGILDRLSLSLATDLGQSDLRSRNSNRPADLAAADTRTGLSDLRLHLAAVSKKGPSLNMPYGLRLNVSPFSSINPRGNSTGNRFSGGTGLEPYGGVEIQAGSGWVYGSQLSYRILSDRKLRIDDSPEEYVFRGGNTARLAVFAEFSLDSTDKLGLANSLSNTEDTTRDNGSILAGGSQFNYTSLYGLFDFEVIEFTPAMSYGTRFITASNPEHLDDTTVSLGFRASF